MYHLRSNGWIVELRRGLCALAPLGPKTSFKRPCLHTSRGPGTSGLVLWRRACRLSRA